MRVAPALSLITAANWKAVLSTREAGGGVTRTPPNRIVPDMTPAFKCSIHENIKHFFRISVTNEAGRDTNDIGIIYLPNSNKHVAVAVFVADSSAGEPKRELVIARMAKAAFNQWR